MLSERVIFELGSQITVRETASLRLLSVRELPNGNSERIRYANGIMDGFASQNLIN